MDSEKAAGTGERTEREYPERPIASVAACVFNGDRILVIKRGNPPSEGRWSVPGGMIELGETLQDAVKRELVEECGIEIDVDRVSDVESAIYYDDDERVHFHYVVTYMIAYYTGGELRPGPDELDARWVERRELDGLDMHPAVRRNMIKAYEGVNTYREY